MLAIARGRGQNVIPIEEWRKMPDCSFSAAISCFVLHYGVPADDLARIARQLKPGGSFSANVFKPDQGKLDYIVRRLAEAELHLQSDDQMKTTPETPNRHIVFIKRSKRLGL